ncbi:MAG TPA: MBL fold metallo-hydrolase [Candidatus Didemnitutus sp.]|nr:MBL fold metallo-hydrolase [Candidatus Didemnitutus sp.]
MSTFPISDHCDGERFFNSTGVQARSFSDLPRWWWQQLVHRTAARWPDSVPLTCTPQLPPEIPAGHVAVTFIGHSTFLLQFPGLTVLTDPIFATCAGPLGRFGPKRVRPPAMALEQLPPIDVVLVSHNHYDHLDIATLRWLALARRPLFVTTLGNKAWLEAREVPNVVELDWWQSHQARAGLEIVCTPAHHFAARTPWDRCKTLWGGLYLRTAAGPVFFCGDSGWAPHFAEIQAKLGAPALTLMPIGAYEPRWFMTPVHMNPDEAVRAHLALGARQSIGMHFGTFQLTDEAIDAPLEALAVARKAHGMAEADFTTLDFGETRAVSLAR